MENIFLVGRPPDPVLSYIKRKVWLKFPSAGDRFGTHVVCRVGQNKHIIEPVFMFAEVDCGMPKNLTHATVGVNGTVFKCTANYTCDVGFMFPRGATMTIVSCDDKGNWSTTNGTCEG